MLPVVNHDTVWIYGAPPVAIQQNKMQMLTTGKIAILGTWHNCTGAIAWHPLPGRDKEEEKRRGL